MRRYLLLLLTMSLLGLSACDVLTQPTPTPIYVTATSGFIIVTNTPTPSPSPVLAPTIPLDISAAPVSPTPTVTPSPAMTMTRTFTPTPTDTPVTPGAVMGPVGGISVTQAVCTTAPQGGFGIVYTANQVAAAQIGCPVGSSATVNNAYQTFERGLMVWVSNIGAGGQSGIYAIFNNGTYQRFNDTWRDGIDPVSMGMSAPSGLTEPIRGFGKVWRESPGVRDALGWATSGEIGGSGVTQTFERGDMIFVSQNGQSYLLVSGAPGTWISASQPY